MSDREPPTIRRGRTGTLLLVLWAVPSTARAQTAPTSAAPQAGFEEVPAAPPPAVAAPAAAGFEEIPSTPTPPPALPLSPVPLVPEADLMPSREVRVKRTDTGLLILGGLLSGIGYLQSAIFGFAIANRPGRPYPVNTLIPVIGPILFKYDSPYSELLFVSNTAAQASGLIMIITGCVHKEEVTVRVPVSLVPTVLPGGAGLSLSGLW